MARSTRTACPLPRRVDVDRPQQRRPVAVGSKQHALQSSLGCRGIFPPTPYNVSPLRCASSSTAPPGVTNAATSAMA